ncbi:MAG: hypothetical protein R6U32_01955 [Candidatus Woesearchaeota archaeon]
MGMDNHSFQEDSCNARDESAGNESRSATDSGDGIRMDYMQNLNGEVAGDEGAYIDRHEIDGCLGKITAVFYKRGGIGLRSPEDTRHLMVVRGMYDHEGREMVDEYGRSMQDHMFITPELIEQEWFHGMRVVGLDKRDGKEVDMKISPETVYFLDSLTREYYPARSEQRLRAIEQGL